MKKFTIAFLVVFTLAMLLFNQKTKAYASPDVTRIFGSDRYSTAVQISKSGWGYGSSEYAILATGDDYPDALCAAPLARKLNAPILLTEYSSLRSEISEELTRLGVKNLYIIGGLSVISKAAEDEIVLKGITCTRIFGNDRYETSIKIASLMGEFNEIVVATDTNFPDALSIAPIAAKKGMPIILSTKDELPESVSRFLKNIKNITRSYILGGTEVISNSVAGQLPGNPIRIYGNNRFETNTSIIKTFSLDLNFNTVYVATGMDFPDALAGSAIAPMTSSPIILVDKNIDVSTKNLIAFKIPLISKIEVLGGESIVSRSTISELLKVDVGDKYNDYSLRYYANYKVKVYNNVNWVPVNTLGKPNLTKEEILKLGKDTQLLQKNINTLYDLIQFIRAVDFKLAYDEISIDEGGYKWQHYKPGSKAISSNEGSYATISNLANYLLKDKYQEAGFLQYSLKDGSGHVLNYIKQEGKYYIFDLTHYRNDFRYTAVESGKLNDYYASDFIAGNVHEANSLEDYAAYCIAKYNDAPVLFSSYVADNALPVAIRKLNGFTTISYPIDKKDSIHIIYDLADDNITYDFVDGPTRFPFWI